MRDRISFATATIVCAANLALWVLAATLAGWAGPLALAATVASLVNTLGMVFFLTLFISPAPLPAARQERPQRSAPPPAPPTQTQATQLLLSALRREKR